VAGGAVCSCVLALKVSSERINAGCRMLDVSNTFVSLGCPYVSGFACTGVKPNLAHIIAYIEQKM